MYDELIKNENTMQKIPAHTRIHLINIQTIAVLIYKREALNTESEWWLESDL